MSNDRSEDRSGEREADPGEAEALIERILAERAPHKMVPDLGRIADLMDILGSPQRTFESIHLTGTNGKTSTARMIDALLSAFGLHTGRFTSPHLENPRERISFDGKWISARRLLDTYRDIEPYIQMVDDKHLAAEGERLTFHELLTGLAYAAFADAPVDLAVVEVGMGGRWDATNLIDAPVAVFTPISLDHTQVLGNTVAEIATEKSGIISDRAIVVTALQPLEAMEVLQRVTAEKNATIAREGLEFGVRDRAVAVGGQMLSLQGISGIYDEIFLPLHGAHQASNAAVALAAVEAFLGGGRAPLDIEAVRAGFASATSPGRLEVVRRSPTIIVDGAHNPAGAESLAAALGESFNFTALTGVVSILADKDAAAMLDIFEPVFDQIIVTSNGSERCLPADELGELATEIFDEERVTVEPDLARAIEIAIQQADESGELGGAGIVITGSLVTVGKARALLHQHPRRR